jgi:prevent-host-death family protein
MLKIVSAVKVRQNLGEVMNEVALRDDEYIVERAGKPLVAIIPVEKYLSMKRERDEFFRMYHAMQAEVAAEDAANIDRDIEEALAAARR